MSLTIAITKRCNLDCRFCFVELGDTSMYVNDVLNISRRNPHMDTIHISGGEPFNGPRIIDMIEGLYDQGKNIHIATNGTIIPEKFLSLEEKIRKRVQVQVSLHASNKDLFMEITGHDKFDKVIENIGRLKQSYSTHISSAIYQKNLNDVPNILDLTYGMGLPIRMNLVYPVGKGKEVERLTRQQISALQGILFSRKMQGYPDIESPLLHQNNCYAVEKHYGIEKKGQCPIDCKTKLYIHDSGKTSICEFLDNDKDRK